MGMLSAEMSSSLYGQSRERERETERVKERERERDRVRERRTTLAHRQGRAPPSTEKEETQKRRRIKYT